MEGHGGTKLSALIREGVLRNFELTYELDRSSSGVACVRGSPEFSQGNLFLEPVKRSIA